MIKATVKTTVLYQLEDGTEEERNVSMTAYYSIPVRTKEEYYISGATYVVYDSAGANPSYNKGAYRIFGLDESIDPIWKVAFLDKNIAPYVPQIVVKEGSYKLSPKTMYIQDMPQEIAIICYYETKDEEENVIQHHLWCQPLMIWQNQYGSTLLNEWNGSLKIDENNGIILSTMVGAGKKESNNTFSGVLMGDVEKGSGDDAVKELGLYGYHQGAQSFGFKVDGTAFLGKSGKGQILFDGNDGTIQSADFDNGGMKINLNDGILESKNDGGSLKIDPTKASELFRIKGPDGATLMLVGNEDYYLQSANYKSNSTGMKINLKDGTISSKYFNTTKEGSITAKAGSIAGWTINESSIASNDGNMILYADGTIKGGTNFSVTSLGSLTAKSGTIGGWTIKSDSLTNGMLTLEKNSISFDTATMTPKTNTATIYVTGGFDISNGCAVHGNLAVGKNLVVNGTTYLNGTIKIGNKSLDEYIKDVVGVPAHKHDAGTLTAPALGGQVTGSTGGVS